MCTGTGRYGEIWYNTDYVYYLYNDKLIVYPMKYTHVCCVFGSFWLYQLILNGLMWSICMYILQGWFTGTGATAWFPQWEWSNCHYIDVIMTTMASQITSLTVVYSIVYSDADQRKHQSSATLAFVRGIHRGGEFPAQMASYAENVSIWWRHHDSPKQKSESCV